MSSDRVGGMDILLIESAPGIGRECARDLALAGHRAHRCWDDGARSSKSPILCVGATRACPLDRGIDIAVLVHHTDTKGEPRSWREIGATCALTSSVPLVALGDHHVGGYEPWVCAHLDADHIVEECGQLVRRSRDDAAGHPLRPTQDHSDPFIEMYRENHGRTR